jgi:hypothetical protein
MLLLSGGIDLSDLEHATLMAASKIAWERNKNWPVLSLIIDHLCDSSMRFNALN